MKAIDKLFKEKKDILSIYFTAGYPTLESTQEIIKTLEKNRTDLIEVGLPYSDPIADGPVIQKSSQKALENSMCISLLFSQLKAIKKEIHVPLILMGYYNQFLRFGEEAFLKKCKEVGLSGIILADLPAEIYQDKYRGLFEKYELAFIFLVTPKSSDARILKLSKLSKVFLYVISSTATTGVKDRFEKEQLDFFKRIQKLNLKIPTLIGFGISNRDSFSMACQYAQGGIIGSAFINALNEKDIKGSVQNFIESIV
ncbi:tryptophan synthase subunit alpha [Bacteroidetes bacterium endosymbiont of Geopemphigus sp.]|uniref:tryptophan synthase subunit alpha n=1 Tax=Bacteroidetes bacterium endosymbiont of Geopemphigus sp. TaxID=2047937 RepID=UPI000CD215FC|nr:tryptophan synthase subunit alpha [Bacteroidetes bacterium endosymbiont of Geopemphigus sp.]